MQLTTNPTNHTRERERKFFSTYSSSSGHERIRNRPITRRTEILYQSISPSLRGSAVRFNPSIRRNDTHDPIVILGRRAAAVAIRGGEVDEAVGAFRDFTDAAVGIAQ